MSTVNIVLLVILAVLIVGLIVLYFLGKKAQKKRDEQEAQLAANSQTVSMLIIDKKRLRLKDSGLPQVVIDQTPKMMRRSKLPIVKAKVGPKVMSLIADEAVYDLIPLKKEVKATVSGIYITKVTGVRGPLEKPQGKKSFRARMQEKAKLCRTSHAGRNYKSVPPYIHPHTPKRLIHSLKQKRASGGIFADFILVWF